MKPSNQPSDPRSAGAMTGQACFVRVTGTRSTCDVHFVEFEFAIGDPALAVELVLRFEHFREFCARHAVQQLTPEDGARLDYERMKWRYGAPGIDH